jgi:GNAT superfamily N-acetyltransferase
LKIRRATSEEAEALTKISNDAKRHWGYPEHWLAFWQTDLTISPEYITKNEVYVAEDGGALLGFYGLVINDDKAELDHMWVTPAEMGRGVGKELFVHAMQKAAGQDVSEVEIHSDPNAEGFYKKMGASRVGELQSEIEGQARVLPRLKLDPRQS